MKPKDFSPNAPGELNKSPDGLLSFIPAPLPPAIDFQPSLVLKIVDAERAIAELAAVSGFLPNSRLLAHSFLRREAVLSSHIEGTVTRLDQLLLFEVAPGSGTGDAADVQEVANYVRAIERGLSRLKQGMPLCFRLLREIHEILMEGVRGGEKRPGQFRACAVMIGREGQSFDEARFVPPHRTIVPSLLDAFEKFLNAPAELPLVVRLALAHYQFEAIHPFMDGNGRIGRLLITLMLSDQGKLPDPLLYLSAYFDARNEEYRDHLLNISRRAAWNEWIEFFAVGVAEQARDAVARGRKLLDLRAEYRKKMQGVSQTSSVLTLVDALFSSPYITIAAAANLLGVTHRSAMQNIQKLESQKILKLTDPRRKTHRVFYAPKIVSLLMKQTSTASPQPRDTHP